MTTTIPVKADNQPAFNKAGFCLPPPPSLARSAQAAQVLMTSKLGSPTFAETCVSTHADGGSHSHGQGLT
jgi:hypothetical protein